MARALRCHTCLPVSNWTQEVEVAKDRKILKTEQKCLKYELAKN